MQFHVPAVPVAQPRPRAVSIAGQARVHGPPKSHAIHDFRATVRLAAEQAYSGPPLEGPIRLGLVFVLPRPKAMRWKKRPTPRAWHAKKPDWDNLAKAVCDAVNGTLWVDDAQVCAVAVECWIAAGDEQPHVEVSVEEVSNG